MIHAWRSKRRTPRRSKRRSIRSLTKIEKKWKKKIATCRDGDGDVGIVLVVFPAHAIFLCNSSGSTNGWTPFWPVTGAFFERPYKKIRALISVFVVFATGFVISFLDMFFLYKTLM
ncbi:hypothetical protein RHMOL_Rhmol04G0125500 [Rhododendron molle]|uniref:Uncharacterized protein n=1 Tax=Rhododendron molle TaxID=49168 RepID=A0ACC0NZL5_RHOML|nr:hypothetical protein RHMOL_Rhmol04G0125500 [Rhododendron molle]